MTAPFGFAATLRRLGADPASARAISDELLARYAEPHRVYHGLGHVDRCLSELARRRDLATRPDEVEAALWFHDAVWAAGAADNEERSALLAEERLRAAGVGEAAVARIAAMVRATVHRELPEDSDARLVVDVDLAGLADPPAEFDAAGEMVRREAGADAVPGAPDRREGFFRRLLARGRIYGTPAIAADLEGRALANIGRAMGSFGSASPNSQAGADVRAMMSAGGDPMLSRILVPLDGSLVSEGILVHVRKLLHREDAVVHLMRAIPEGSEESEADVRLYLDEVRSRLVSAGADAHFEVRLGDPTEAILRTAEEVDASLIAMSTHGRSGVNRWFRGSVAERVLREAPRPLLLANPTGLPMDQAPQELLFRKIILPLDGSENAARIIPLVTAMAKLYGSEVVILHSPPVMAGAIAYPDWQSPALPPEPEVLVKPFLAGFQKAGIPARIRTGAGLPASDILDAVEDEDADLVAMTTHGRTGLSRWVFGSVAEKVLRHCRAPLLVLRIT